MTSDLPFRTWKRTLGVVYGAIGFRNVDRLAEGPFERRRVRPARDLVEKDSVGMVWLSLILARSRGRRLDSDKTGLVLLMMMLCRSRPRRYIIAQEDFLKGCGLEEVAGDPCG